MDNPNNDLLFNHVINGNINAFNTFMIENPTTDLNDFRQDGDNLLHVAIKHRKLDFVKLLVDKININNRNREGHDALLTAIARCGSVETYSNMMKYYDIIKYLILTCGANCATRGMFRETPLISICRNQIQAPNVELKWGIVKLTVELLLANGADRDIGDICGRTAEVYARSLSHGNVDLADFIRDYGEVPETKGCYETGI